MRAALLAALLAAWARPAAAEGRSGAAFLKLSPGARPAAMGDAFSAVADDVHAVYFNPAGLARLERPEASGMHQAHVQGIRYEFAGLALPLATRPDAYGRRTFRGTLAFAVYNLAVSGLERRGTTETDAPTGTFGASDLAYAAAYARSVSSAASFGAAVKFIHQELDGTSATAFAVDAGGLYRAGRATLAAGLRNLGTSPKFREASDPLPRTLYAGLSWPAGGRTLAALDLRLPRGEGVGLSAGVEHRRAFDRRLTGFVRAGFNTANREAGGLSGFSLGAGLGTGGLSFDFAWVPFGSLGESFRYSLLARF